jgi:rhomboid protease GluP
MDIISTQEGLIPLENLSETQFLALSIETSKRMGLVFRDINQTGFIAYTYNGLFAWNAEIKLKINEGEAIIQSKSTGNGLIDVRENKKNIQNFISTFMELKKSISIEELLPIFENMRGNFQ